MEHDRVWDIKHDSWAHALTYIHKICTFFKISDFYTILGNSIYNDYYYDENTFNNFVTTYRHANMFERRHDA